MISRSIVAGPAMVTARLPGRTRFVSPGLATSLAPTDDLAKTVAAALDAPLDRDPLSEQVRPGMKVTIAFDDPTVPCYAPMWATALPQIVERLERGGVQTEDVDLVCANSLHRRFNHDELARTIGEDFVRRHAARIRCHDGEDEDAMVHLGTTSSGHDVVLGRSVVDSDLTIYLNCSTTRGFSGGWKSVCVGLSGYRSIRHHHTPDIMSMSLDRNEMHAILDEMGALTERSLGPERIFKLETVLSNPAEVHTVFGGSVGATRAAALDLLRSAQPARRTLIDEPVDVVVYGVPDWSPYAAFSHTNPILDLVSTGLGYLGGMIQALGRPGCTVVLASPCPLRWNRTHHPSYEQAWNEILTVTRDPEEIRARFEPDFVRRREHIEAYRTGYAFHPVHATMALYPLKRLRHAGRVIVAGPEDPSVPAHLGFDSAPDLTAAVDMAVTDLGGRASIAVVDYPMAFNRA